MKIFVVLALVVLVNSFSAPIEYLIKYKYLLKEDANSNDAVVNAIKDLQRDSGLVITGTINIATGQVMKLKRCGVDVRVQNYVEEGSKWNTSDLTYRINKYTYDMSKYKIDRITAKSFKFWADVSPLTFTQVKNKTVDVDIEIMFVTGAHGDGLDFDGVNGKFAHAFFPQYGGDAHFDDDEYWDEANNYEDSVNLLQVMTHEFGHSLGLRHSEIHDAVMFTFYGGYNLNFALHQDDIDGIQALYGGPNDTYTTPTPTTPAPFDRCEDGTLDAISHINNGHYYAFRRDYAMKLSSRGVYKSTKRIDEVFPGVPGDLDAVFTWPRTRRTRSRTFFLKGELYWTRKSDGKITGPRSIECGFEGVPSNVDAVFMDGTDTIFVKGDLYYRYIRGDEALPPVNKSSTRWRKLPDGMDAAFYHPHLRHHYFFFGRQYYRMNHYSHRLSKKYPRTLSKWWLKC